MQENTDKKNLEDGSILRSVGDRNPCWKEIFFQNYGILTSRRHQHSSKQSELNLCLLLILLPKFDDRSFY